MMVSTMYKAQLFEERLSIAVILTLLKQNESIVKGILASKIAKSAGTVIDRIDELQTMGLVIETKEDKRPFRKFVELTPKGREVAERLAEIEDLLKE